ncbi:glycosyl hydrolase 2 galactose-binding domain-containing protein [Anaerocolumna sp. MB42-C2]|uniref:glycosyl hydrolase 2 galactose-binding domain-containing protein n=1 Tax=Anaerocolumna sp. MB42-C2 TaxID=3070997 RepID=UPI0027E0D441|nr:sugar-binding domain-containing protein [Anaerocolumna sp. MB42-C2]WMJ86915.1 beta-mannosidase [Anaerocolumna sp. MB42-C2]
MRTINLNKKWEMLETPLKWNRNYYNQVRAMKEGWYQCDLPVDVRMPLLKEGKIKEPLLSDYCRETEWIEDRSWWFVKRFDSSEVDSLDDIIELVLEGLDCRSDIFINGRYLKTHRNVHYPFIYDIKEYIIPGENVITVRLTSGLEEISKEDMAELDHAVCIEERNGGKYRGDERRAFVRRPQYTVGWDWGPKVITIGITGNVFLRSYRKVVIREVKAETLSIGKTAELHVCVNVENLSFISTRGCDVEVTLWEGDTLCASEKIENTLVTSGYNFIDCYLSVENPKLWWPNGYGAQPLYRVVVKVLCEGNTTEYPAFSYGIRTIKMDTSVIQGEDRNFTLLVNDKPIYCKGGNWIPNDFIYARVPDEKYHVLTDEAIEANFNMLRVWGGGLYERDIFYELCDKKGILLWHDFMFACSTYPDHHQWFRDEMYKELDFQTKRLRNHCCIGLFCGTNEVHWIFNSIDNPRWNIEFKYEFQYGLSIPNHMVKEILHKNCEKIPYWNSSPYGGALPNADTVGDVHRWHNALMSPKMEERIEVKDYDTIESKFVSEYGFIGPCCKKTTLEYMEDAGVDRRTDTWRMHCNVFERGTVYAGIEKNYVDHADQLSLEDYILYGGMVHGLMYGYSLEAMRFKEHCSGSLFWMYNDAWGEVGWTIIDYYLRRKIPFYAVKRALAHQKFTLRLVDDNVVLQGINDLPEELKVKAWFGYVSFDGKIKDMKEMQLTVAAGQRIYLHQEPLPAYDYTKGTIMLYVDDETIDNVSLRMEDNRKLHYDKSAVLVVSEKEDGEDKTVTVTAEGYVHGVYVKGDFDCSDAYFDLLPGEVKTFTVKKAKGYELIIEAVR